MINPYYLHVSECEAEQYNTVPGDTSALLYGGTRAVANCQYLVINSKKCLHRSYMSDHLIFFFFIHFSITFMRRSFMFMHLSFVLSFLLYLNSFFLKFSMNFTNLWLNPRRCIILMDILLGIFPIHLTRTIQSLLKALLRIFSLA